MDEKNVTGHGAGELRIPLGRKPGRERIYKSDVERVKAWRKRKRELGTLEELRIRTYNLTMRDVIALKAVMAKTGESANQVIGRLLVEAAKRVGTDLT
jgi:hypothetical protein